MAVPHLNYTDIVRRAVDVYHQHNGSDAIPVDIERIIDNGYRIDIYPSPGLMDRFQIDAYISCDLTEIHVDKRIYEQRPPNRYRFSLAHEFAHLVLHADLYRSATFQTPQEWKAAMKAMAADDYDWLEWQANAFAGLLLVPPHHLATQVRTLRQQIEGAGVNPDRMEEPSIDRALRHLGQQFGVSKNVIAIRLKKDGLWVLPQTRKHRRALRAVLGQRGAVSEAVDSPGRLFDCRLSDCLGRV